MFHAADIIQLQAGETIRSIHRRHAATMIPGLALASLFLLIPSFFLFTLLQFGAVGTILAVFVFGYGLFLAAKTLLLWDSQALLLTNRRVVHVNRSGMWRRSISETPLPAIQSVEHKTSGPVDMFLRTAQVEIAGAGGPLIVFRRLPKAGRFASEVMKLKT